MWFKENKKAFAVAVLVLVLVIYLAYSFFKSDNTGKAVVQAPAKNAATPPAKIITAIRVDVDLLKKAVEPLKTSKNIFTPVYIKPVLEKPSPQPKGNAAITVTPLPPLPPPPPPKSQEEIDADNAREEMQKVKVLGFLKRKQRTDVFLSLGNSNYIVGKGDVITKGYYLEDVAKDSITVSDRKTGVKVKASADFSGKNAKKNLVLPGVGQSGASSPVGPQPNPGTGGAVSGRPTGQRTPERAPEPYGGGAYGGVGAVPAQNTGGTQGSSNPPPLVNYSTK